MNKISDRAKKYNKLNQLRVYLNKRKSLDSPGLDTCRMVLEDYDRMRLQLSVFIGELKVRKRVSANVVVNKLENILWEDDDE